MKKDNVVSLTNYRSERDCWMSDGGFIRNCTIQLRHGEKITQINHNGEKVVAIDGYAIIPKDEYVRLRRIELYGMSFFDKLRCLFGLNEAAK